MAAWLHGLVSCVGVTGEMESAVYSSIYTYAFAHEMYIHTCMHLVCITMVMKSTLKY